VSKQSNAYTISGAAGGWSDMANLGLGAESSLKADQLDNGVEFEFSRRDEETESVSAYVFGVYIFGERAALFVAPLYAEIEAEFGSRLITPVDQRFFGIDGRVSWRCRSFFGCRMVFGRRLEIRVFGIEFRRIF